MRVQRPRSDVLPLTWEIPAAVVAAWSLLALLLLPAAQGLAAALSGHNFGWPRGALIDSILGLVAGQPGRGLPPGQVAELPPMATVYTVIALAEVALTAVSVYGLTWWWRTVGPGAQHGLATTAEVRRILGPANLRQRRFTIRPDLHRPRRHRRPGRPGDSWPMRGIRS